MTHEVLVYVSVLNWNKASTTLACLEHLFKAKLPPHLTMKVFVVDNGSRQEDWGHLSENINNPLATVIRLEQNLGFCGGHNIVMQRAIDDAADYVWLVNNDGVPLPETLANLASLAGRTPSCGAVSPLIVGLDDKDRIDFCGAYHDWKKLMPTYFDNVEEVGNAMAMPGTELWLVGAAVLFKVKAIKQIGLLDETFFAYYEDNDISARLLAAGWRNIVDANARFQHEIPNTRPPYFYYLMARNACFFWSRHTPKPYRRFMWLRLLERAVFSANKLLYGGEAKNKADACLLGGLDGLLGHGGAPDLNRKVPWFMVLLRKMLWFYHIRHINHDDIPINSGAETP
ncbi:glycosyltransferase family 2 protein [Methylovulum miyakonense]|uniref:glycosyltransferase family 2 protein n=1 Tax=Methylovulum miyakonense TaxID=645578 RepID=UPI0003A95159|nr:glycosyltransferase family 2 protein [Methylovulum miyakonense]